MEQRWRPDNSNPAGILVRQIRSIMDYVAKTESAVRGLSLILKTGEPRERDWQISRDNLQGGAEPSLPHAFGC
jgi:hypothetical protein